MPTTARLQIIKLLEAAGLTRPDAHKLLAAADNEPRGLDMDNDTTLEGGHALIVEYGDCEFYGSCQCGAEFGMVTPDKFGTDAFGGKWERHVMKDLSR